MSTRPRKTLVLLGLALVLAGTAATAQALTRHLPTTSGGDCPLLGKATIAGHFPVAEPTLTVRVRAKPYESCTFTWQPLAQAERLIGGQVVRMPGQGRVSLTRAPVQSPDADWARVMNSYRNDVVVPIPGLGQRAVWSGRRSQVSVLGERHVFHVMVEDSDAPNRVREQAEAMARELLANEG